MKKFNVHLTKRVRQNSAEAKQLLHSLRSYMSASNFKPKVDAEMNKITNLLK